MLIIKILLILDFANLIVNPFKIRGELLYLVGFSLFALLILAYFFLEKRRELKRLSALFNEKILSYVRCNYLEMEGILALNDKMYFINENTIILSEVIDQMQLKDNRLIINNKYEFYNAKFSKAINKIKKNFQ